MKRLSVALISLALLAFMIPGIAQAAASKQDPQEDEDFLTHLHELKWGEPEAEVFPATPMSSKGGNSGSGGQFSKSQIENFRCSSSGDPSVSVDLSCNTTRYGQVWAPDNAIAVAVDPQDGD